MTFYPEPTLTASARDLFESVNSLPIVSPHGHCDPNWWASDVAFPDPAELLIIPDHYVFRMLYSQGVPLSELGIGVAPGSRDPRAIFRLFANHWHCFLGTPSREWMEFTLYRTLGVDRALSPETADIIYDQIAERLAQPEFRPRALFDVFGIDVLATTDPANDPLSAHSAISASGWSGRTIPTFRPDSVLDPARPEFGSEVDTLGALTGQDTKAYEGYLEAIRIRRAAFRALGATATDHDVPILATTWLSRPEIERLHSGAVSGTLTDGEKLAYYGHLLVEMAQMSAEDGMVMQLHVGSRRNTNRHLLEAFGRDMGSDIPVAVDWVSGMDALLNRVGNDPRLRVILFTLDETTYARELAPMAGHWPCLRIGPPWWFHDSPNGIRRYFDQVVETAGYFNLAGFNDDTRAFLSIPARHDTWRRGVCSHLADQVGLGRISKADAETLAPYLCRDQAREVYRLNDA
ncbi:MAG: glucuronate isomerase [Pseudomonadota bacterium]